MSGQSRLVSRTHLHDTLPVRAQQVVPIVMRLTVLQESANLNDQTYKS
jgi:hypothetical protein